MRDVILVIDEFGGQVLLGIAAIAPCAPAVDLPPAGQPGRHCVAQVVRDAVLLHEFQQLRSRSDEGHLAAQNVDELR